MAELRRLSGREAIRALERLGFVVVRQRGSHMVLRCGERGCVVPLHRQLAIGTLGRAILDPFALASDNGPPVTDN